MKQISYKDYTNSTIFIYSSVVFSVSCRCIFAKQGRLPYIIYNEFIFKEFSERIDFYDIFICSYQSAFHFRFRHDIENYYEVIIFRFKEGKVFIHIPK